MNIKKLTEETKRLNRKFKVQMTNTERMVDLTEEVGELAQAMLIVEKKKLTNDPLKKRTKADIADALADIFYDLLLLADTYGVDLEDEYESMLSRLDKRIKEGEFDGDE